MIGLIRRRLIDSDFGDGLAAFNGEPAIFYAKAPDDTSTDELYPHAVFTVDRFSDAIHGVAGIVTFEILCTQETIQPEALEVRLRQTLEGVFFNPDDGEIFMLKWKETNVFREPASERLPMVIGALVTFEVREFPSAETTSPDPIQALNLWAANFDESLTVIGVSEMPEIFEPTFAQPAVYFDAQRTRMTGQTHSVTWLETLAVGHIFCEGVKNRRTWTNTLALGLMNSRAVFLADGSPMRLTGCEQLFNADEIQGQLQVTLEFGALKPPPFAHPLNVRVTDVQHK